MIDEEVSLLIETQYQRAIEVLTAHKDKLEALAEKLLTDEVIFKEDLEQIFGKRPWEVSSEVVPEETAEEVQNETLGSQESDAEEPSTEEKDSSETN